MSVGKKLGKGLEEAQKQSMPSRMYTLMMANTPVFPYSSHLSKRF